MLARISLKNLSSKGDNEMNYSLELSNSLKCVFVEKFYIETLCTISKAPNVLQ